MVALATWPSYPSSSLLLLLLRSSSSLSIVATIVVVAVASKIVVAMEVVVVDTSKRDGPRELLLLPRLETQDEILDATDEECR